MIFNLFKKKEITVKKLSLQDRFFHFQKMIESNDEAHKAMSELADMIMGDKPFSRGFAFRTYYMLIEKTRTIVEHFNALSNYRYNNLATRLENIIVYCDKILSPKLFCPEGWNCPDRNCHICEKISEITYDIPYTYNLNEINDSYRLQVGSKMSRLAEIKNVLKIPVPEGFCITVKMFEDIMNIESIRERKNKIFYGVDFEDVNQIRNASQETQEMFVLIDLPEKLKEKIFKAYDDTFIDNRKTKVSVRSSAIGEDSDDYSFAGIHSSVLNVGKENLEDACLEVLISKYSPQALVYRYMSGLRDEDMPMSVGCMQMIDPVAAGVLYTSDPYKKKKGIIIQAVKGLGSMVVNGQTEPQEFVVSISENPEILSYRAGVQKYQSTVNSEGGVSDKLIEPSELQKPYLSIEQIAELVRYAIKIELHFKSFQDIEWAIDKNGNVFILQARNLAMKESKPLVSDLKKYIDNLDKQYPVLIHDGDCASKGITSGVVHIINNSKDISDFPKNGIIVAKKNLQEFASLIHKATGVITDSGSTTGHLSIIARELNIPLLTNTHNATELLKTGMTITLLADENRVYLGEINDINQFKRIQFLNIEKFRKSPMYRIWHQVTKFIFKLNLLDPNSVNFKPDGCNTIHDIIRFAHEKSLDFMFSVHGNNKNDSGKTHELDIGIPLGINIIDLGDGLKEEYSIQKINEEQISSEPLLALIKGLKTPGIQWSGHLSLDFKGFASIILNNFVDDNQAITPLGSKNYILVSKNYFNFFTRLGYHFSRLDAFTSEEQNRNFINFNFRGGAADHVRKMRRAKAIQSILIYYHFDVNLKDDNLIASIRKIPKEETLFLIGELGRLMGAVRNTDVTMLSDEHVDIFVQGFLEGDPAPAFRYIK